VEPLRTCKYCGREAYTQQDLERFTTSKTSNHTKNQMCKACVKTRYNQKHNTGKPAFHRYVSCNGKYPTKPDPIREASRRVDVALCGTLAKTRRSKQP